MGIAGVSMGVGFTIMMAGLMQGFGQQMTFLDELVDTMPHITVEDQRVPCKRDPPSRNCSGLQMPTSQMSANIPASIFPEVGDEPVAPHRYPVT